MNKFACWRAVYRDNDYEAVVIVKAEKPEEAINLANEVMKERFKPEHLVGLELFAIVWGD